ncbi:hypothetical protein H2199_008560 [Coniosporium tulheliwenetii]|uniref:Uncharacterized protein n=1 Tax=Coniosporium tulheliwenetii TaxID=3383036 RepID=A0ACC2YJ04_9PEZI|nr:hypothetical protein H2199_008560 [Cladosporium sp. JES 115]
MWSSSVIGKLGLMAWLAQRALSQTYNPCVSYGMDFQNGGSYCQNASSTDPFTFVSQFDGCQVDTAVNLLIDPSGNQYQCSYTNLTPDDTDQLATCPLNKDQLTSGEWSVVVLSNNGASGEPIAYQRDFYLSVGIIPTYIVTPTVTGTAVVTPIYNYTSTTTDTLTTMLVPVTITKPSTTLKPTITTTPSRVTTTKTSTLLTIRKTVYTLAVVERIRTATASCRRPTKPAQPDPTCTIVPTINGITAAAMSATATPGSAKFRRADKAIARENLAINLEKRRAHLAAARVLNKRAPDTCIVTSTEENTALWGTTTITSYAPTSTVTIITDAVITQTVTPPPVTLYSGRTTASIVTITAPTPTRTRTRYTIATTTTIRTLTTTVVVASTTTPPALITSCRRIGGIIV